MLAAQDIAPQHTSKRRAERQAERAVVDADSHAVHGAPESAVGDSGAVLTVNFLPSLDNAGEQDGGADVCACEL